MKKTKKVTRWEDRMPTIDLRGKNYPDEVTNVGVDDEVELIIKAKLIRKEEGSYDVETLCDCDDCEDECPEQGAKKRSATFKATSIKVKKLGKSYGNSKEGRIADKYNKYIKQGMKPSQAMKLARKG